ncbi:YciI family protein [Kutzneria viridogrisea]|uniref:YCII-related domain-containing protein n=2 Tax=Kutzneria TaxID=43356 RepID=W5WH83_9PSEU|nr:hypothetical protein KALB_7201 [Kutzneria albida DSM 43870]MBA8925738.1 hypothetical protein [Kutzneria viridogrisea]
MKYMLMIHANVEAMSEGLGWELADIRAMVNYMHQLNKELADSGELLDAQGLGNPEQSKKVQARPDGEPVITDGPFPEAKEVLAGYWLVDVADERRVVEIATRISVTPGPGGAPVNQPVQIHPIGEAPEV